MQIEKIGEQQTRTNSIGLVTNVEVIQFLLEQKITQEKSIMKFEKVNYQNNH